MKSDLIKYLAASTIIIGLQIPVWTVINQIYQTEPAQYEISDVLIQEISSPDLQQIDPQAWQAHQLPGSFCVWECQQRYKVYQFDIKQCPASPLSLYVYVTMRRWPFT